MKKTLKDFLPPIAVRLAKRSVRNTKATIQVGTRILSRNKNFDLRGKYLYFGNLGEDEKQFQVEKFIGLALVPITKKDIIHNAYEPLPCPDNSIPKIQAQDVFEHLEYDKIPAIFD